MYHPESANISYKYFTHDGVQSLIITGLAPTGASYLQHRISANISPLTGFVFCVSS